MRSEDVFARLKRLWSGGVNVRRGKDGVETVDRRSFMEWALSALNVIGLAFGRESDHYRELKKQVDAFDGSPEYLEASYGIVEAAYDDYEAGFAGGIAEFYAAEVFDDMLAMALHLHENGYHIAAVSIAGAVLEDNLRKLHAREVGPVPEKSSISVLNEVLKDYYGKPTWHQVQAWAAIRNEADHGRYSNSERHQTLDENGEPYPVIDPRQVRRMIDWTRDFIDRQLT